MMISRCGAACLQFNISESVFIVLLQDWPGHWRYLPISLAAPPGYSIIIAAGVLQADTKLVCVFCRLTALTLIIVELNSEDLHLRYGLIKMPIYIQYMIFMTLTIFIIKTKLQI